MASLYCTVWIIALYFCSSSCQDLVCDGDVQGRCPCPCRCTSGSLQGLKVDCSKQNLNVVPGHLPKNTTVLDLSSNNVNTIHQYAFWGCWSLHRLTLSENQMVRIHVTAFKNLTSLIYLDLSKNNLSVTELSMPRGLFHDLEELTKLHLSNNLQSMKDRYRDDLMCKLHKLTLLSIDGLPNGTPFEGCFKQLRSLEGLFLYGDLTHISNETFKAFERTAVLYLGMFHTNLNYIDEMAFGSFPSLQSLILSHNHYLGMHNLSKSWPGLRLTNLSKLSIIESSPATTTLPYIMNNTFFQGLEKTKVTQVNLIENNVVLLATSFSTYLPFLESLTFVDNDIADVSKMTDLPRLKHLKYLEILISGSGPKTSTTISLPRNLETLRPMVSKTLIRGILPPIRLKGQNRLRRLDMSGCNIRLMHEISISPPNKTEGLFLLLEANNLKSFDSSILSKSISEGLILWSLKLSSNHLGPSISGALSNLHHTTFEHLTKLQELHLEKNSIDTIASHLFAKLINLYYLDLSNNNIHTIGFLMQQVPNLNTLDISFNYLSSLDHNTLEYLNKSIHIYIDGNPMICSCDTLKFMQWFATNNIVKDKEKAKCTHKDDLLVMKSMDLNFVDKLQKKCSSKTYIIWTAVITCVFALVIALAVFLYRHRWDVKFLCLHLVRQRKSEQEQADQQLFYKYDAFVAYHSDDSAWVLRQLLPNIEKTQHENAASETTTFTLCVHQRDFIPGTAITDNIIESVNKSRKTILVLSRGFVTSSWCDFELQMARTRCFDEGRDLIIAIMLEDVPAAVMTSSLRAIVRRVTYLEWPAGASDKTAFWQQLKASLAARDNRTLVCECGKTIYKTPRL